jgi:chondroitin AC lyase
MKYLLNFPLSILLIIVLTGWGMQVPQPDFSSIAVHKSAFHVNHLLKLSESSNLIPRTLNKDGTINRVSIYDWTSGFFAGTLWYEYKFTRDSMLKKEAIKWTNELEPLKDFKGTHDLGFMMYCSFGNAYQVTNDKHYKDVLVQSAKSLISRYDPVVGCIKSWDHAKSRDTDKEFDFPVIIDNMMNLELLFFASKATNDPLFKNIAVQHARTTLKNHIRPDFSCYHVVNYNHLTGKVISKETNQGYANNSAWARGQAWAVYGFTVVYRETKAPVFLHTAEKLADFFLNNPTLPADLVPLWDFNAMQKGYIPNSKVDYSKYKVIPRDASTAAIFSSALLELGKYSKKSGARYLQSAEKILKSLASDSYTYNTEESNGFILKHCVGNFPANYEIDVPLNYADYYYLESLSRYRDLLKSNNKNYQPNEKN